MNITNMRIFKFILNASLLLVLSFSSLICAKNIGTIGQLYSIKEVDFLDFIQARALSVEQNGLLKTLQNDMQKNATLYRDRPTPVSGIEHTQEPKSWLFDPSIVLDHDVKTPDGKLIAAEGARVNPLVHVSLNKTLIFYDADDKNELQWILEIDKKLKGKDKIILVNGSILKEEKRLSKQVYFDQSGRLAARFNITHVPATVEQEGVSLRVSEVKP
jgi:conjugal transfer pilus assembly protein TraW